MGFSRWLDVEVITTVVESAGFYRLYSDDREIGVSKDLIPEELDRFFHGCTVRAKMEL